MLQNFKGILFIATALVTSAALAGPALPGTAMGNSFDRVQVQSVTGANGGTAGGTDKSREDLSITAADTNGPVADATCTLKNEKGDWSVSTPDTVKVRRSDSDLTIQCSKPGYDPVSMTYKASTTQIPRPHFRFSTDAGGDGGDESDDSMVTVPQYSPAIKVIFGTKQASVTQ